MSAEHGIAVVRRNTEEVQGCANFEVFQELFAADFVDHTPQPGGFTPGSRFGTAHEQIHDSAVAGAGGKPELLYRPAFSVA